jgi:hypothetical protein
MKHQGLAMSGWRHLHFNVLAIGENFGRQAHLRQKLSKFLGRLAILRWDKSGFIAK